MPMSIYVISVGCEPQHRLLRRLCRYLPTCVKQHIQSETLYTLHLHNQVRLHESSQPPLYNSLPPPPPYNDHLVDWVESVMATLAARTGGPSNCTTGADSKNDETNGEHNSDAKDGVYELA